MPPSREQSRVEQARVELARRWEMATEAPPTPGPECAIPGEIVAAIWRCVNSKTKTYRYVLPTQLLAKVVEPALDCRSVQEGSRLQGSFDARSLCTRVVVPFDRDNHNVLGGSADPYVNNPLRIESITPEFRPAQRDPGGFDDLAKVLAFAEENPALVGGMLDQTLREVAARRRVVQIAYPVPHRVSQQRCLEGLRAFLTKRTGGTRLQAVCLGLFRALGETLHLFASVVSQRVNAADARTGKVADLNCFGDEQREEIVLAVEVKDQSLTLRHVEDKLPGARANAIRELIFLVKGGVRSQDAKAVDRLIEQEFARGQNVYVCEFETFVETCLAILGEKGRQRFLVLIGEALDEVGADLSHREGWRDQVRQL